VLLVPVLLVAAAVVAAAQVGRLGAPLLLVAVLESLVTLQVLEVVGM
jgi:hypothetical protein